MADCLEAIYSFSAIIMVLQHFSCILEKKRSSSFSREIYVLFTKNLIP